MPDSHSRRRRDTLTAEAPVAARPCVDSFVVLAQTDPFSLPPDQQVELLQDLERHAAWVDSLRVDVLAALAGPGPEYEADAGVVDAETRSNGLGVNDSVRDEVMAAIRVSGQMAEFRITAARDLHHKLPRTRQLLRDGECSYAQVTAIVSECERLTVAQARVVEERALNRTGEQTPAQTRASVRRAAGGGTNLPDRSGRRGREGVRPPQRRVLPQRRGAGDDHRNLASTGCDRGLERVDSVRQSEGPATGVRC